MYLDDDFYLCKRRLNLQTDLELINLLEKCFNPYYGQNSMETRFSYAFAMLVHLCHVVSYTELSSLLGGRFSSTATRKKVERMVDSGHIVQLGFGQKDMGCNNGYALTASGYEIWGTAIPLRMGPPNKIRRRKGAVPMHDYGIGLSLLQLLLLQCPFEYTKETVYSSSAWKKNKGSLCVDASVHMLGSNPFSIFIEQDMATERKQQLIEKIASYGRLGILRENDCLVFSCYAPANLEQCPSFRSVHLEKIKKAMEASHCPGIYALYETAADLEPKTYESLRHLLVRLNVCRAYDADNRPVSIGSINQGTVLRRNKNIPDFTPAELEQYIEELKAGNNPYRIREYNAKQYMHSKKVFKNLSLSLWTALAKNDLNRYDILFAMGGHMCYVAPSVLLSNSYDYMASGGLFYRDTLPVFLSRYYPGIEKAPYEKCSRPLVLPGDYPGLRLRNIYTLPDGPVIAVEHIGQDIGGFLRCSLLSRIAKSCRLNLHIICLCDNDRDMVDFCQLNNVFYSGSRLPSNEICFLYLSYAELMCPEGHLKQVDRFPSGQIKALPLSTPAEKEALKYRHNNPMWWTDQKRKGP